MIITKTPANAIGQVFFYVFVTSLWISPLLLVWINDYGIMMYR